MATKKIRLVVATPSKKCETIHIMEPAAAKTFAGKLMRSKTSYLKSAKVI